MRASNKLAFAIACLLPGMLLAGRDLPSQAHFLAGYGGQAAVPVKSGQLLYVPTGATLTTWNYRNPDFPWIVSDTSRQPLDGAITALVQYGDYLYASWQGYAGSGVAIYSLAKPNRPKLVDRGDQPQGIAFGRIANLAVQGDKLFVFDSDHGLVVQSLANPLRPRVIGTGANVPADVTGIADGRLLAAGRTFVDSTSLSVYDVSKPRSPKLITSQELDGFDNFRVQFGWPRAVGFGLSVNSYTLSPDGGAPVLEGSASTDDVIYNGFVAGDTAYGLGQSGLSVWSLRAPVEQIGHVDFPNAFATDATYVQGRQAWALTSSDQLATFDIARPKATRLASVVDLPGGRDARDAASVDGRLVLLENVYGLATARDEDLQPLGRFDADLPKTKADRDFEDMYVAGRRAYLAAWGYGLIAVDLGNPLYPRELGRTPAQFPSVITGQGRYVFLGQATNGGSVTTVDVADPAHPQPLVLLTLDAGVRRFQLAGKYLFAATGGGADSVTGGLRVIDVRKPKAPALVGSYVDSCNYATDLALSDDGKTAYLRCLDGLHILDVSHPEQPVRIGFYDTGLEGEPMLPVAVDGKRAFLGSHGGIDEIDIRHPRKPALIAHHTLPASATRLRVMPDRRLFAFTGAGGIAVFDLSGGRD